MQLGSWGSDVCLFQNLRFLACQLWESRVWWARAQGPQVGAVTWKVTTPPLGGQSLAHTMDWLPLFGEAQSVVHTYLKSCHGVQARLREWVLLEQVVLRPPPTLRVLNSGHWAQVCEYHLCCACRQGCLDEVSFLSRQGPVFKQNPLLCPDLSGLANCGSSHSPFFYLAKVQIPEGSADDCGSPNIINSAHFPWGNLI